MKKQMDAKKKVLAVIPARGGSKGVKNKNLRIVAGKSLVARSVEVSIEASVFDAVVVSTDDEDIKAEAELSGARVPFFRPARLSGDRIGDLEVLQHAINVMEAEDGCRYDTIAMIQPTSPCRKASDLVMAINKLKNEAYDSVWTVSRVDLKYHPMKQLCVDSNNNLFYFSPDAHRIIARQQLSSTFYRNGVCYCFTRDCLMVQQAILGRNSGFHLCDGEQISIDTEDDLQKAEELLALRA